MEVYSTAYPSAVLAQRIPGLYAPLFVDSLGGKPSRYEWRLIAKGDFWFYDNADTPVYAERDMVELYAFREELGR